MLDSIGIHCTGFHKNPFELHWKCWCSLHCQFQAFPSQKGSAALGVSWRTTATKNLTTGDFSILVLFNWTQTAITGKALMHFTISFVFESKKLNIQLQTKSGLLVGHSSSWQLNQSKKQSKVTMMMIRGNKFNFCAAFLSWGWRRWWWWRWWTKFHCCPMFLCFTLVAQQTICPVSYSAFFLYCHKLAEICMFVNLTKYFDRLCLRIRTQQYIHCMITNQ